jgi:hypothetical protein
VCTKHLGTLCWQHWGLQSAGRGRVCKTLSRLMGAHQCPRPGSCNCVAAEANNTPLLQQRKGELLLHQGVTGTDSGCCRHSLSCCPSSRQSCSCLKHVTAALGCTAWPNHAGLHQGTVTGLVSPQHPTLCVKQGFTMSWFWGSEREIALKFGIP